MPSFEYPSQQPCAETAPLCEIAQVVGTPCFVYSHAQLSENYHAFDQAFGTRPHLLAYAVKANSNIAILDLLSQLGAGFDVVSGGELTRVLAAQGHARNVVFSGVGKTRDEIKTALEHDILCMNIESVGEFEHICEVAKYVNKKAPIAFRVNPEISVDTHPYIATAIKESKFGIDFSTALDLYQRAKNEPHIDIKGLAYHIGSQICEVDPFIEAAKKIKPLLNQLRNMEISLSHLDIGGGLGIRYQDETLPTPQVFVHSLLEYLDDPTLKIIIEPGRAICGNAGVLITQVLYLKQAGSRHFCIVDAGMNDLIRPALYNAWHEIVPLKRPSELDAPPQLYDIAGPICESGDYLGKARLLSVKPGDFLAIHSVGAYGTVMSSQYNSKPRAPEVMVKDGQYQVIRARETIEDLFKHEKRWTDLKS